MNNKIYIFRSILWLMLLLSISTTYSREERTFLDPAFKNLVRRLKIRLGAPSQHAVRTEKNRKLLIKSDTLAEKPPFADFPCDRSHTKIRSDTVPTNVNQVRPGDIDIIAAMGDSLSAGTGISSATMQQELFSEERGRSWSIGGEADWKRFLTLANILKEFNPKLFGYSLNTSQSFQWDSQFNVAENGAISQNLPFMAKELVKRIKNDKRTDLKNHWKMITIMAGHNDFCSENCYYKNPNDILKYHRSDVTEMLRYLRDNLPRTIVNLVPPLKLDILADLKNPPKNQYLAHNLFCPCIAGLQFRSRRKELTRIMEGWQQIDREVSNMPEFDSDEFTVILHNYTSNYTLPTKEDGSEDYGYLAPDVFHFSERGQARFANDLWNSLLEPYGKKTNAGRKEYSVFHCPSDEHPYIYTRTNSK
ncbi:phospholipase B1, membrane-associated-like [Diabrotica undecimpunctata]|uniref:phospholipase B1, membrane-associated-like n=1 Tax=Diabrotica undecimpunctata TaxID=50387 RepID=UPI003B63B249